MTKITTIVHEDLATIAAAPLPWEVFSGTNVLVTGASGFLPAYMVETLLFLNRFVLSTPATVTALVRNEKRGIDRFAAYQGREDLQFLIQDVSAPLQTSTRFEYIIHAASNASPSAYLKDAAGTIAANMLGTHHLLNAATGDQSCKGFLFFSSGEIYGSPQPRTTPLPEDEGGFLDPVTVRACYGEGKRIGETMCATWARQFGLPTRIVRPGHTYGPGMKLNDGRVFADFVRDILQGGPIVLLSDGSARRPFCYLADATVGFFTVLLKASPGEAYNVVNSEAECSISDLADRLAAVYKEEGMSVRRAVSSNPQTAARFNPSVSVSTQKIASLGWSPKTTIEEGFRRTVESYREAGRAG